MIMRPVGAVMIDAEPLRWFDCFAAEIDSLLPLRFAVSKDDAVQTDAQRRHAVTRGLLPARLRAIFACDAPVAAVFRRGPSKWTLVFRWNTANDTFEMGDWHFGRIYDERSDLSPSGERLLYFANSYGHKSIDLGGTWSAVSLLAHLTPIVVWPKGDTWGGGGAFIDESVVVLRHDLDEMEKDGRFSSAEVTGHSATVLTGWQGVRRRTPTPDSWVREHRSGDEPGSALRYIDERLCPLGRLRSQTLWLRNGVRTQCELENAAGVIVPLDADWVEYDDLGGRLVGSHSGCLFEIAIIDTKVTYGLIIDLNDYAHPARREPSWCGDTVDEVPSLSQEPRPPDST
jgi:hypothetical protein